MRRRDQLLSIKKQIKRLSQEDLASLPFVELRRLLTEAGLLDTKVDVDRQVAMLLSYVRGNTTDEDARWNLFG